ISCGPSSRPVPRTIFTPACATFFSTSWLCAFASHKIRWKTVGRSMCRAGCSVVRPSDGACSIHVTTSTVEHSVFDGTQSHSTHGAHALHLLRLDRRVDPQEFRRLLVRFDLRVHADHLALLRLDRLQLFVRSLLYLALHVLDRFDRTAHLVDLGDVVARALLD